MSTSRSSENRPRITLPSTPPQNNSASFASYVTSSPTSYTTPTSSPSRSVVMGGLVSRPSSPDWDEKRAVSIDVPGIVLTEPPINRPLSPPPKSITLLSPTSLEVPLKPDQHPPNPTRSFSSSLRALLPQHHSRLQHRNGSFSLCGLRSFLLCLLVILGAWHLYMTFGHNFDHHGVRERYEYEYDLGQVMGDSF